MPHFFVNSQTIKNDEIVIEDKELLNHLVNALRVKSGESLSFFDENKLRYETTVLSVSKNRLLAKIQEKYKSQRFLKNEISLMASILKQDAFNELISGVTQLGVKGLYPLYSDNTALSKSQIENKTQKWQKISDESVKQCERIDFMTVFPTVTLDKFDFSGFDKVIVFSEIEKEVTLKSYLQNEVSKDDKILVIVGPEGGFSKNEFEFFEEKKFAQVKISDLILKAQNACISGVSNIIFQLEA